MQELAGTMLKEEQKSDRGRITMQMVATVATDCFRRYGVHRTSMADIADTLGVSRQTVYRLFENRSLLLEYVATARMKLLYRKLVKYTSGVQSVHDALVGGMLYSLRVGREDKLLHEIVRQEGDAHFKTFLFGGTAEIQEGMLRVYAPFFAKGRETGEIADNVTDLEIIEWMCNVGAVLNIRDEYDEAEQRRILEKFLVPSILRRPSASTAPIDSA